MRSSWACAEAPAGAGGGAYTAGTRGLGRSAEPRVYAYIVTADGQRLPTPIHSICVHGDNAHAVATATALRSGLLAAGHRLGSLPDLQG